MNAWPVLSGARRGDVPTAGRILTAAPNGLELTGDGGAAAGVRCSDVLGGELRTFNYDFHRMSATHCSVYDHKCRRDGRAH